MDLCDHIRQTDLADRIGVKKATVNQVLTGKTAYLNALNSALAAKELRVDHHWLATGDGEARPLLMMERLALSARAVHIGNQLDAITDPDKRAKAYALMLQVLELGAGQP